MGLRTLNYKFFKDFSSNFCNLKNIWHGFWRQIFLNTTPWPKQKKKRTQNYHAAPLATHGRNELPPVLGGIVALHGVQEGEWVVAAGRVQLAAEAAEAEAAAAAAHGRHERPAVGARVVALDRGEDPVAVVAARRVHHRVEGADARGAPLLLHRTDRRPPVHTRYTQKVQKTHNEIQRCSIISNGWMHKLTDKIQMFIFQRVHFKINWASLQRFKKQTIKF